MENPYYQAARFMNKAKAGQVYTPLQEIVFQEDCDLSVYRFKITEGWHVVVVGEVATDDAFVPAERTFVGATNGGG